MQKIEFYFPSCDEIHDIHAVVWKPEGKVRAIVQISHGMIEYINRYEEVAEFLTARGILVAGNDHLGHGQSVISETEWGFVGSGDAGGKMVKDLHTLSVKLRKENPDVPFFLIGHSMGSFLARRYAMTYGREMAGAVFIGTGNQPSALVVLGRGIVELIGILFGEYFRSKSVNHLMFGLYNRRFKPNRTPYDWLSRNNENVDKYRKDKACTFLFTANGYKMLFSTIAFIEKPANITLIPANLPILFLSGEEDPVGNYGKGVRQAYSLYKKKGIKDVSIKLYPEARHEILNEINRSEVYEYLYQWLNKRITAHK